MLVPSQPGYQGTNFAFDPSQSVALLKKLGFKKASDGYFQPNFRPAEGQGPDVHDPVDVGQHHPVTD